MRLSREDYEAAVARMRLVPGGKVSESDFLADGLGAYRYAVVKVEADADCAPLAAHDLATVAVQVKGYLVMHVRADRCSVEVSVSRDLEPKEADGLVAYRDVESAS